MLNYGFQAEELSEDPGHGDARDFEVLSATGQSRAIVWQVRRGSGKSEGL
jgi:hypothetical protein